MRYLRSCVDGCSSDRLGAFFPVLFIGLVILGGIGGTIFVYVMGEKVEERVCRQVKYLINLILEGLNKDCAMLTSLVD